MYNTIVKQEYIAFYLTKTLATDILGTEKKLVRLFDRLGAIESDFDTDLASADYQTLTLMLNLLLSQSTAYHHAVLSDLRQYINWSIMTGNTLNNENKLEGISAQNIDSSTYYSISMIKDEDQLIDYLNIGYKDIKEETIDNLYRVYLLLLYNGIKSSNVLEIKELDVNFKNGGINFGEKYYQLSDNIMKEVKYLCDMKGYYIKRGSGFQFVSKVNQGYLLQWTSSNRKLVKDYCKESLSKFLMRYREITNQKLYLNATNISKSGIFHRMYLSECENGDVNLNEFNEHYITREYSLSQLNHKRQNFLLDYTHWKNAFSLR